MSSRRHWRLLAVFASTAVMVVASSPTSPTLAVEPTCPGGSAPDSGVIWCDDFEDGTPLGTKYYDYDSNGGEFVPVAGVGFGNSTGLQVVWQTGEEQAGGFKRMFGRNPIRSQSHGTQNFREIYWRQYLKMAPGWSGNPYKLSRATIFASSSWAQAMIAHVWGDGNGDILLIDPASGIDANNNLVTTRYNDFDNLRWLGWSRGTTEVFAAANADRWYCIESHAKLNTPGLSDGLFELRIDGRVEAAKSGLNWVGSWQDYGINAVAFENFWNRGAPGPRVRFIDNIVISTRPIGCLSASNMPGRPTNLRITVGAD